MYSLRLRAHKPTLLAAVALGAIVSTADAQTVPTAPPAGPAQSAPSATATAPEAATPAANDVLLAQQAPQGNTQQPQGGFGTNAVVTGGLTPPGANANVPAQGPTPAEPEPAPEGIPAETPATSSDLEAVNADISGVRTDLENFKFQWQRERDIHTAITTRYLKIGGVVQARFGFQDQIVHGPTIHNRKTTFDVPTAQLTFNGSLYKDYEEGRNLNYSVRFGVSQQANTNNSFLNLLDANVSYDVLSTVDPESNRLSVTFGQQLLPFGLEVPATEELKPVIRNAQFSALGTGLSLVRREIGLIIRGELFPIVDYGYNYRVPILAYAFGVINGNGPNLVDDNNWKDLVARVAFTVPSDFNSILRQITIGASAVWGEGNVYIPAKTNPASPQVLVGRDTRARYGVDVYYNHWPIGVTYEFVEGQDPSATGTNKGNHNRLNAWSQSHTGTLFYSVGEQFVGAFRNQGRFDDWWPKTYQPFLRYDRYRANAKTKEVHTDVYTAGFNLFFAETTKFQLNYNLKNTATVGDKWKPNHEILAQAQFGF